jgi:dTMP kinase
MTSPESGYVNTPGAWDTLAVSSRPDVETIVRPIWAELDKLPLSVSHDRWHLDRVLSYALGLHAVHGGDLRVLVPAVLLHDLGRTEEGRQHGLASIEASTEQAANLLGNLQYPESLVAEVLRAIADHDQPDVRPALIEGRILKDADFLAGFGAWGILRIAMWSGETGRDVAMVLDRLVRGMSRRSEHLEFEESVVVARRELRFVRLFVERLRTPPVALEPVLPGAYVVLEGISGSGKDTQAERLRAALVAAGVESHVVCEPHGDYRRYREAWERQHGGRLTDPRVMRWLMMADRQQLVDDTVRADLAAGTAVVSVRSYLSTMVYQAEGTTDSADIAFAHTFVPEPDLVVLLDLPPDVAWERIQARNRVKGVYESEEQLAAHRVRYLALCEEHFPKSHVVVDATADASAVAERVLASVLPVVRDRRVREVSSVDRSASVGAGFGTPAGGC